MINRHFDVLRRLYTRILSGTLELPARRADAVGHRRRADRSLLHVLAEGAGADGGSGLHLRDHPGSGELDDRSDEAVREAARRDLSLVPGDGIHVPGHLSQRAASVEWRPSRRDQRERSMPTSRWPSPRPRRRSPAFGPFSSSRRRCPEARASRWMLPSISTEEPAALAELANDLVQKAMDSGKFMFADTDLKFDQPQAEGGVRSRQAALRRASTWPRPAAISRCCWAATTSIASAFRVEATR